MPMKSNILIVDDDADIRNVLRLLLQERYEVSEAADGAGAVEYLRGHPDTDLVILDVMMPGMSGYETCDTLREPKSTSRSSMARAASGLPRYSLYRRSREPTLASSSSWEKGLERKSSPPLL